MFIPPQGPPFSNRSWSVHSFPEVLLSLTPAQMTVLDATALARSAVCVRCASSSPQYAVRIILRQAKAAAVGRRMM